MFAGVHNGAGFRPRVLHKPDKRVDVDLLMANPHGKYITDEGELAFARVGFLEYDLVGYRRRAIIVTHPPRPSLYSAVIFCVWL